MNVLGSNPDIIRTKTVIENRTDLTVTVNRSRNCATTRITACAIERNGHEMFIEFGLRYKRASQELRPHTRSSSSIIFSCFLHIVFFVFLIERVVSYFMWIYNSWFVGTKVTE